MPSLDTEQIELLQLENDLLSLDSSYMGEPDDWDTEVAYNRLNYLIAPTNSAHSSTTHETFTNHLEHSSDSDLRTDQRIPSAISHQINNVIHDSNSECDGSQHDNNLPIPCSPVIRPNETTTKMLPDIVLLGDIRHSTFVTSSTHDNNSLKIQENNKGSKLTKVFVNSELEFNEIHVNNNTSKLSANIINIVSQEGKHDNSNIRSRQIPKETSTIDWTPPRSVNDHTVSASSTVESFMECPNLIPSDTPILPESHKRVTFINSTTVSTIPPPTIPNISEESTSPRTILTNDGHPAPPLTDDNAHLTAEETNEGLIDAAEQEIEECYDTIIDIQRSIDSPIVTTDTETFEKQQTALKILQATEWARIKYLRWEICKIHEDDENITESEVQSDISQSHPELSKSLDQLLVFIGSNSLRITEHHPEFWLQVVTDDQDTPEDNVIILTKYIHDILLTAITPYNEQDLFQWYDNNQEQLQQQFTEAAITDARQIER